MLGRLTVVFVTTNPSTPNWKKGDWSEQPHCPPPTTAPKAGEGTPQEQRQAERCGETLQGLTAASLPAYLTDNAGNVLLVLGCQVRGNLHQHGRLVPRG